MSPLTSLPFEGMLSHGRTVNGRDPLALRCASAATINPNADLGRSMLAWHTMIRSLGWGITSPGRVRRQGDLL